MMNFLLSRHADLTVKVRGIIWGKGYEWETLIPAVNPISYAMMGCLPQMHRNEITISNTVTLLLKHAYGINYLPVNVPNKYLRSEFFCIAKYTKNHKEHNVVHFVYPLCPPMLVFELVF